ncbi:uncharacterized protein LOC62_04G005334 [Vanrija pseudolonga]|uniref:Uncharacterized protein n=1 Tax=Vanrija pseudolonga TaxID=143232 RepID=A0AAF0YBR0_9TREE|nr:hypothetical protein LOC62_04G005334 [Vanrija pseudolonga]
MTTQPTTVVSPPTPAPPTTPTVTLNHTAYPYIIDTIVANCSFDALLALRRTSKTFLARCNAILLDHAKFNTRDGPSFPSGHDDELNMLLSARFPGRRVPPAPQYIRTLDLVGHGLIWLTTPVGFTKLETLRRMQGAWRTDGFSPSTAVVDFLDFSTMPHFCRHIHIPAGPIRSVIHFRYNLNFLRQKYVFPTVKNNGTVEDVTIVLWPTQASAQPKGFLVSLILSLVKGWDMTAVKGAITLVGMDREDGGGMAAANLWDMVEQVSSHPRFSTMTGGHLVSDANRPTTRFLTREEWWTELGDRKAVEGEWPTTTAWAAV